MIVGLLLGGAALVVACSSRVQSARWPLLIAAAVELGVVPCYTTLASRRLRYLIALIDLDLEEGLVGDGTGRVQSLFGIFPVLEDIGARRIRLAPVGRGVFAGLRVGTTVAYRYAAHSRIVLWVDRDKCDESGQPPDDVLGAHHQFSRCDSSETHQTSESWCRSAACLT
jgi:hypothetical protein